ncbi:MAG: S8 family serine peptidase [Bacteroidota bacterium]
MKLTPQTRFAIGDAAASNYKDNLRNINHVIVGIDKNRRGELNLSDITNDRERLKLRISREAMPVEKALERINGINNFQDTVVLQKLERLCRTVCRISLISNGITEGYGTGFLIGNNLLITNHHVLPDVDTATGAIAEFNYELDDNNQVKKTSVFRILPQQFFMTSEYKKIADDPFSGLDFTIVAVEEKNTDGNSLSDFGFTKLDKGLGKIIEGENCVVIQHPQGQLKKVVLKDIRMLTLAENTLVYESDTLPGSSGSMVIGLGTGELVALHHSGVPRTDDQGNWLRKDGSVAGQNDGDDLIDWIGNEGIRVSRLAQAVQNIPLAPEMDKVRKQLIKLHEDIIKGSKTENQKTTIMDPVTTSSKAESKTIQYFEVLLSDDKRYQKDWISKNKELVSGIVKSERLFPSSTNDISSRLYYLTVKSDVEPWTLAREIESLPHVASCTPDIPLATDAGIEAAQKKTFGIDASERAAEGLFGKKKSSEEKFIDNWKDSKWVSAASKINKDFIRQWNWLAINHPLKPGGIPSYQNNVIENLKKLKFVQLDTGYSSHPKIYKSYDLAQDLDFISDDADAMDELDGGILRQPGHGTRTASLTLGVKDIGIQLDGNQGILTDNSSVPLAALIPYRVSKSVILIQRGKEMVDAASHAVRNNADVMFMCMGSIPRDMFDVVAREAYEQGVIWVCAAGNQVRFVIAPACYPGTIAVAAMNPDDKEWDGSCRGEAVDISAPGEDCYVPGWDDDGNYIMSYGSGTSYATPHIASAAMLWKATNLDNLSKEYEFKWQIVEAFRQCLKDSARKDTTLDTTKFGAGVLDLDKLLKAKLPKKEKLTHAYTGKGLIPIRDLGEREMAHAVWNNAGNANAAAAGESFSNAAPMSKYAAEALKVLVRNNAAVRSATESAKVVTGAAMLPILESYFKPY